MILLLCGAIFLVFISLVFANRFKGLPPGPTPWPFFGNLLSIPPHFDEWAQDLKKRYGNVFTIWIPYPTVVIAGHEITIHIENALLNEGNIQKSELKRNILKNGEAFAFKPDYPSWTMITNGRVGILNGRNEHYRTQRRFNIQTLKTFGMGKQNIQETIMLMAERLNEQLLGTAGQPIIIKLFLQDAVNNVIYSMLFGGIRPVNEPKVQWFIQKGIEYFEFVMSPRARVLDIFPVLRYFDDFISLGFKNAQCSMREIEAYIQAEVQEHKKTLDYDQEPTNYVDEYLLEMKRREKEGEAEDEFSMPQLVHSVLDLYAAGYDTIVNTLRTAIITLLNQPHLQKNIQEEIDAVIGNHWHPNMTYQPRMPYTNAFIEEIYRVGPVLAMNFIKETSEDVECEGYTLRKGTHVLPQYHSEHFNEKYFSNPHLVVPERHLRNGEFIHDKKILPFSLGRRSCAGESLARVEVFIFLTSMLQKLSFIPESLVPPERKWMEGSLRSAMPFKLRVIARN